MTLILTTPAYYQDEATECDFYIESFEGAQGRYKLKAWGDRFGYSYWKIEEDKIYFKHEGGTTWTEAENDSPFRGSVSAAKPMLIEILSQFDKTFFGE